MLRKSLPTARYLGLRVQPHGRGPDVVDCWGLMVLFFAQEFGIALDPLDGVGVFEADRGSLERTIAAARRLAIDWHQVVPGRERPGDILLLSEHRRAMHAAVVLDPLQCLMLHADCRRGVVAERWSAPSFGFRVHGRLRHPTLAALWAAGVAP